MSTRVEVAGARRGAGHGTRARAVITGGPGDHTASTTATERAGQSSLRVGEGFGEPLWPSPPEWWPSLSLSLSLCEGRGRDDEELGREVRVDPAVAGRLVRPVEATPPVVPRALCGADVSGSTLLGSSSDDGVRLTPVGEPRPVELSSGVGSPLGTIVSAEPMGLGPVGSRTLVLSAAAVPPATSTAATVSAAMPPVLFTPPR
jgi:hypothetical protein